MGHCPTDVMFMFPFMCSVDVDEIKRLGKRFRKLDLDNSGSLSIDEFMSLPELQQNPLVQRVIDIFDTDGNGEVDFKGEQFVCSVCDCCVRLSQWNAQLSSAHTTRYCNMIHYPL